MVSSQSAARENRVFFKGKSFDLKSLGLEAIERDVGTGYHQPKGILVWSGDSRPQLSGRAEIKSQQFAPTVLNALGVAKPEYMADAIQ